MDPLQLIVTTGGLGVAVWVLKLAVDGKLHTSSETDGLKQDKVDLLKINERQGTALDSSNTQLAELVPLIREILVELREGPNEPD